MEIKARNVNDAFRRLVTVFQRGSEDGAGDLIVRRESRNGPVLMIDEPVTITYERPLERVLLNEARDANPFALLYEPLWMLAGRNDVAALAHYLPKFKNYSDGGETLNGAYGDRWRHARTAGIVVATYSDERDGGGITGPGTQANRVIQRVDVDQLGVLVQHIKADPTSRRAVLQMWNVEDDLLKIESSKDVCCNTSVIFSLRELINGADDAYDRQRGARPPYYVLNMIVTNRSNDLIWGTTAADFTCFSFLQEYMAARLGIEVGKYYHFSNNLHVYTESNSGFHPEKWLDEYRNVKGNHEYNGYEGEGGIRLFNVVPLVRDPEIFEKELPAFIEHHSGKLGATDLEGAWTEPFLQTVAGPMLCAFACHKEGDYHGALILCDQIEAGDWRQAATAWIRRRMNNKMKGATK